MENRRNHLDIVDLNTTITTLVEIKSPIDNIQVLNLDSTFDLLINLKSEIEDII